MAQLPAETSEGVTQGVVQGQPGAPVNVSTDDTTKGEQDSLVEGEDGLEAKINPEDVFISAKIIPEFKLFPFEKESKDFVVMTSLSAPFFRSEDRAPIDLICVVDESSSMEGQRIALVRETLSFIAKNLENGDRLAIIGYATKSQVRMEFTEMNTQGKDKALDLIKTVKPNGCTNLCAGLVHAIRMMKARQHKKDVSSIMLFTDGQVNEGLRSKQDILKAMVNDDYYQSNDPHSIQGGMFVHNQTPGISKKKRAKKMVPAVEETKAMGPEVVEDTKSDENEKTAFTVNCFGFGKDHNEDLLQGIAEAGRGMYAFIEKTDQVADTFADCLGGLVSIVGKDIVVRVEVDSDVKINKCLSEGFTSSMDGNSLCVVKMPDLQSQENRDLLFELTLPKLEAAAANVEILEVTVEYTNVVQKKSMSTQVSCSIARVVSNENIGEKDEKVAEQVNRIVAANAMKEADLLASKNQIEQARQVLSFAEEKIGQSSASKAAYSKNLVAEMQDLRYRGLATQKAYKNIGGKKLKMSSKVHGLQRSVQTAESSEQYENFAKKKMKKKFKH